MKPGLYEGVVVRPMKSTDSAVSLMTLLSPDSG